MLMMMQNMVDTKGHLVGRSRLKSSLHCIERLLLSALHSVRTGMAMAYFCVLGYYSYRNKIVFTLFHRPRIGSDCTCVVNPP